MMNKKQLAFYSSFILAAFIIAFILSIPVKVACRRLSILKW
jgi:hypothetical protein